MKRSRKVSTRKQSPGNRINKIQKKITELKKKLKMLKVRKSSKNKINKRKPSKRKSYKRKPKTSSRSRSIKRKYSKGYTKKFEECVMSLKRRQPKCMKRGKWSPRPGCYNPWAVCRSSVKRT